VGRNSNFSQWLLPVPQDVFIPLADVSDTKAVVALIADLRKRTASARLITVTVKLQAGAISPPNAHGAAP
jgi:hypothetical protein